MVGIVLDPIEGLTSTAAELEEGRGKSPAEGRNGHFAQQSGEPVVSAIIIAYNHERYIGCALDSVLMQETSFPYEIIISEDCSTDSTLDVIKDYMARYPDRIRLIRSEVNLHNNDVATRALRMARGRYVTVLDGDDYWVSANKLQAQFDFMEAHPDSAITYHDVARVTEAGEVIRVMKGMDRRATIDDLIQSNFVATCSCMTRLSVFSEVPDWVRDLPAGDWPFNLLAARHGFVDYIEGLVANYRIHGASVWAARPLPEQWLLSLTMLSELEEHLGPEYPQSFQRSRRNMVQRIVEAMRETPAAPPVAPEIDPEDRLRQAEWAARDATVRAYETGIRVLEVQSLLAAAEAEKAQQTYIDAWMLESLDFAKNQIKRVRRREKRVVLALSLCCLALLAIIVHMQMS